MICDGVSSSRDVHFVSSVTLAVLWHAFPTWKAVHMEWACSVHKVMHVKVGRGEAVTICLAVYMCEWVWKAVHLHVAMYSPVM